jgi:GR25 family glycosyltransferase involved in LPS biosynthesis
MELEFKCLGLNATFIEAVDGQNTLDYNELLESNCLSIDSGGRYGSMLLSEAVCYMSHEKVWRFILETKQPYAIVCEDDIAFRRPFVDLPRLIEELPDFDLLYFGYSNERPTRFVDAAVDPQKNSPAATVGEYQVYPVRACGGTYCYLITLQGAAKILARSRPIMQAVDGFLIALTADGYINTYALYPPATAHTGLDSIISRYRRQDIARKKNTDDSEKSIPEL